MAWMARVRRGPERLSTPLGIVVLLTPSLFLGPSFPLLGMKGDDDERRQRGSVQGTSGTSVARGQVAPGFEDVRVEFERNFAERGEIGAAVSAPDRHGLFAWRALAPSLQRGVSRWGRSAIFAGSPGDPVSGSPGPGAFAGSVRLVLAFFGRAPVQQSEQLRGGLGRGHPARHDVGVLQFLAVQGGVIIQILTQGSPFQ